jgi:orotate phosphoribosyltransferase
MNTEDVLNEFRGAGALREGHFVLSSGLHSGVFLQKNLVFQYADRTERLCKALAALPAEEPGSKRLRG